MVVKLYFDSESCAWVLIGTDINILLLAKFAKPLMGPAQIVINSILINGELRNDILFNSGHPNFDDLEDIVKTRIAFWAKNNLPGVQYGVHDFVHSPAVAVCSPVAGCVVPLLWSCYGKPSAGVFAVMNCCCWSYSCWFSFANVCGVEMLLLMFAGLTCCYSCCFATLGAVGAAVYWCCLLLPWVLNTGASSCGKEFDGVLFRSCWKILQGKELAELDGCPCGVNSKKAEKRIRKEREAIIATTMDDLQDKDCWSLQTQIEAFNRTVQEDLPCMIEDPQELAEYLANSIFFISMGGNDYLLNFNNHSDPEYFANSLLIQFQCYLQKSSGEQHRSSGMLAVDDKQDRKWAVR
ncbi:hypothetical protein TEA_023347 [Camellia sinensis var. sinensis]|uniref:Uncharacterized protein n=1 Tax=Camellia sinensis var. sinensis TaxID=542762 RepID=A0A4S4E8J2_CAMSN|nr:hypothetical protein TEA_023347 [Camellia sinensis var. sinensis]